MAVALYAHVSTTKQADKDLSIPDQLRQMRDWCKPNKTEELDLPAAKGKKKRLVIDETETPIVRRIFDLYANGLNGAEMTCLQITVHLSERGVLRRGTQWARNQVQNLLRDKTYMGDYVFNKKDMHALWTKPEDEWVHV